MIYYKVGFMGIKKDTKKKDSNKRITDGINIEFPTNISNSTGGTFISFEFYRKTVTGSIGVELLKKAFKEGENLSTMKNSKDPVTCKDLVDSIKTVDLSSVANIIGVTEPVLSSKITLNFPSEQGIENEIGLAWTESPAGGLGILMNDIQRNPSVSLNEILKRKKGYLITSQLRSTLAGGLNTAGLSQTSEEVEGAVDMIGANMGINPHLDDDFLHFEGIERRTPEFTFRFMPRNQKESETVDMLLNIFQVSSLPRIKDSGIEYPRSVKLKVFVGGRLIQTYNELKIQTLTINKTPEGKYFHDDGYPAIVDLTIALKEGLREYYDDFIGNMELKEKENKEIDNAK